MTFLRMKRVATIAVVVALFGYGLIVIGYGIAFPSLTMRYRLTLEARVDGQPVVGSSVIEVTYHKQPRFAASRDLVISYRGEAVVLDLGSSGAVFALLKAGADSRSSPETIIFRAFGFDGGAFPGSTVEDGFERLLHLSGKRELPLTNLPLLVRFRDIGDPKTVEKVDPNDLAASIPKASLERAMLEIVSVEQWPFNVFYSSPITTGIEKKLSWLPQHYDLQLDGRRYETVESPLSLANSLASGAFKSGP